MFILVQHIINANHNHNNLLSLLFIKGFFSDPKNVPGLAHFLEHLLFMGTSKYPKENEYSQVREGSLIAMVHIIILVCLVFI